ncbi:uncharacterized protein [Alexandromys fortis]|uniref:uncharacterized protein n=1 Tax=Alexandromys fortis TaxID=100897 RepID=UPI00215217BA|nr:uncharacterized protein LOC126506367 [Microtus fortis]
MAPGPRMRTTLTRAGGAAAPVVAPYISAASPRRAARLCRGFGRVAPPCRRLGRGGCGFRARSAGSGPGGSSPAPLAGRLGAPPGLSPALTLPDPEPTGWRCLPVSSRGKKLCRNSVLPCRPLVNPPREIHCRCFCSGTMITQLLFGHRRTRSRKQKDHEFETSLKSASGAERIFYSPFCPLPPPLSATISSSEKVFRLQRIQNSETSHFPE